jgi:hypothetical protein
MQDGTRHPRLHEVDNRPGGAHAGVLAGSQRLAQDSGNVSTWPEQGYEWVCQVPNSVNTGAINSSGPFTI